MSDNVFEEISEHHQRINEAIMSTDPKQFDGGAEIHHPAVISGPMIYIWRYGPDACPTFVTIASSEDAAREAIVRHPEISELLVSPEYLALITAPPSEVIKPEDGAVWVMNWRAEDRLEVEG